MTLTPSPWTGSDQPEGLGNKLTQDRKISYTQTQQQIISQQWLLSLSQKTFLIKFLFHERLTL